MQASTRARQLQQDLKLDPQAVFSNTVFVTLQINAGVNSRTQTVKADVENALTAGGNYSVVPVQVCHYLRGYHSLVPHE